MSGSGSGEPAEKSERSPQYAPGRVLMTGGAGFIGANLVRALLADGHDVTVFDDFSVGRREYLEGLDVQRVEGDILDAALVADAVRGHSAVVHLAAETGVPGSLENPRRDCLVNVTGTLNLLEASRAEDARREGGFSFVFASSSAPLGRQPPPATEDKAPLPISPYGASKLAGEGYCLAYHGSWGLRTVVLRFGNVYGPYSAHKSSVVAKFLSEVLAGRPLDVHGDGLQTRDFIYVGDLCSAIRRALASEVGGEVFQIATGRKTEIGDLIAMIEDATGLRVPVQHGPPRAGDMRDNFSAISKANRLLDWRPEVQLEEGIARTWAWFQEQAITTEVTKS